MIINFRHKGLRLLYEHDDPRLVLQEHKDKLRFILARLEVAKGHNDLKVPGFRLHQLKGSRSNTWSIKVRSNWRVTFRFEGENVADVNYEDYH